MSIRKKYYQLPTRINGISPTIIVEFLENPWQIDDYSCNYYSAGKHCHKPPMTGNKNGDGWGNGL